MAVPLKTREDIESFSEIFLRVSLEEGSHNLDPLDFDRRVFKRVAIESGLELSVVKDIHHSFYWTLFNDNCPALRIADSEKKDKRPYITLNKEKGNLDSIKKSYLANYGHYLETRASYL